MSEKTYTSNIPAVTPVETLPKQFVLDRTDMSTSFSDDEYQACLDAITAGQAVAVNWVQGGLARQLQLAFKTNLGVLKFSYARGYNLETWTVAASSPHSITYESYDVEPTNFAPAEYGTNEVHNLSTTATNADLVYSNYLAIDGEAGTKKLPAECVAPNSVVCRDLGSVDWQKGYINYNTGAIDKTNPYYYYSEYISVSNGATIKTNARQAGNAGYAFYDNKFNFLSGGILATADTEQTISVSGANIAYVRISCSISVETLDKKYIIVNDPSVSKTKIDFVKNDIGKINAIIGCVNWIFGKFVDYHNGNLVNNTNFYYSDYIPVSNGQSVTFNLRHGGDAGYALYDADKGFLEGGQGGDGTTDFKFTISNASAVFMRVCTSILQPLSKKYVIISPDSDGKTRLDLIEESVTENADNIYAELGNVKWIYNGFVDYHNGTITTNNNYYYSDFIPVKNGDVITTNARTGGDAGYALYDEDKVYIDGANIAPVSTDTEKTITISNASAKYIRICTSVAQYSLSTKYAIVSNNAMGVSAISRLEDKISAVDDKIIGLGKTTSHYVNSKDKPIVCFCFDDGTSADGNIVSWMEGKNLVASFALLGNNDPTNSDWKSTIERYKGYQKLGHDVVCHGIADGCSVTNKYYAGLAGFGLGSDDELLASVRATKKSFDYYGLRSNGLAYFNGNLYSPHTFSLVSNEFDFAVGSSIRAANGVNYKYDNPVAITRYGLDTSGNTDVAKATIEANIGKNVLIVFGTHPKDFDGQNGHSSPAQIQDFFDYVAKLRDDGIILQMGITDAVETFFGNVSLKKTSAMNNFIFGERYINNSNNLVTCTDVGARQVDRVTIGGTISAGTFRVNIPQGFDWAQRSYGDVTLDGTETSVEDVIVKIRNAWSWTSATILPETSSTFLVCHDIAESNSALTITDNTTSLTFSVTSVTAGTAPTFA